MSDSNSDLIDVFVLSGFLGSGKTTLLNRLLSSPELLDTAVIVKEFGEITVDHLLVEAASGEVVLLGQGCLCCAAGDTFSDTLMSLWIDREQGVIPRFSRVIVETSGLAEPYPLIATVIKNRQVASRFRMAGVITVVDGVFGEDTLAMHSEAREQLKLADVVLVSKVDLAEAQSAQVEAAVVALNASVPIIKSSSDDFNVGNLLEARAWSDRAVDDLSGSQPRHAGSATVQRSLNLDHALEWPALAEFNALVKRGDDNLLRCKGLLAVRGECGPVLVQAVRSIVDYRRLSAWPSEDKSSRLVFIFDGPPKDFDALISPLMRAA